MKHILLSFFIISTCAFSQDTRTKSKIRAALNEIKTASEQQKALKKDPLRSFTFDGFASRDFLYYYRALSESLVAQSKKDSEKLEFLDKALSDLNLSKSSAYFDASKIDALSNSLVKEKIELAMRSRDYKVVLDTIETLPVSDKNNPHFILYYSAALFESSQMEDFMHLARKYRDLLENRELVQAHLTEIPKWNQTLSKIDPETSNSSGTKKSLALISLDKSTAAILQNPDPYYPYLYKNSYFSDASNIYKALSSLYFFLGKKEKLNKVEKHFFQSFEKHMYSFAPAYLEPLINSFWKEEELKTAEKLCKTFIDDNEGHASYIKTLYNLGRIQEDQKKYKDAAKIFQKISKKTDDATYAELARFRTGWVLYLAKKYDEAKSSFQKYLEYYPDGRYASTSEYFLLKIEKIHNKHFQISRERVKEFFQDYPLNFYSILLMDENNVNEDIFMKTLSSERTLTQLESKFQKYKADIQTLAKLNIYKELLELGLKDEAIKVLKSFPFDNKNDLFALYLASQFYNLEYTNGEQSTLVKLLSSSDLLKPYIPWKGLFPDYHVDTLKKVIGQLQSHVSPYLVLSVVRQESAFDPEAKSTANAMGLMQMTHGTAKITANMIGLKAFTLTNEEDNLKLGISTLTSLLNKYNNRIDYALSAYNAGENVTDQWIRLRGHLEPIEFIESIPYQETRGYIKNIIRNYAVYRILYEKRPNTLISYKL